jgi:vancomycin permeability regulator SanA
MPVSFGWFVVCAARGLALFFAIYSLLSLLSTALIGTYNQNAWWIDLSALPSVASLALQVALLVSLAVFVVHIPRRLLSRIVLALPSAVVAWFAFTNSVNVYLAAVSGTIIPGFPIPFSFFITLCFLVLALVIFRSHRLMSRRRYPLLKTVLVTALSLCLAGFLFPLGQVFCFGTTEYREKVDAAVVLGAQVMPDGTPSLVLQDRIDTAITLYESGLAPVLVMSGGIDVDDVSEARAMRDYAVEQGVPIHAIIIDEYGNNTARTAANTVDTLRAAGLKKVAAVSNFYHLARIKMLYLSQDMDVVTVPADDVKSSEYWFNVAREIPAWWYYWFQNVVPIS